MKQERLQKKKSKLNLKLWKMTKMQMMLKLNLLINSQKWKNSLKNHLNLKKKSTSSAWIPWDKIDKLANKTERIWNNQSSTFKKVGVQLKRKHQKIIFKVNLNIFLLLMKKRVLKEFLKKLMIEKSKKYQRKSTNSMTHLNSKNNTKLLLLSVLPKKITSSKKKVITKEALKS